MTWKRLPDPLDDDERAQLQVQLDWLEANPDIVDTGNWVAACVALREEIRALGDAE